MSAGFLRFCPANPDLCFPPAKQPFPQLLDFLAALSPLFLLILYLHNLLPSSSLFSLHLVLCLPAVVSVRLLLWAKPLLYSLPI